MKPLDAIRAAEQRAMDLESQPADENPGPGDVLDAEVLHAPGEHVLTDDELKAADEPPTPLELWARYGDGALLERRAKSLLGIIATEIRFEARATKDGPKLTETEIEQRAYASPRFVAFLDATEQGRAALFDAASGAWGRSVGRTVDALRHGSAWNG